MLKTVKTKKVEYKRGSVENNHGYGQFARHQSIRLQGSRQFLSMQFTVALCFFGISGGVFDFSFICSVSFGDPAGVGNVTLMLVL